MNAAAGFRLIFWIKRLGILGEVAFVVHCAV